MVLNRKLVLGLLIGALSSSHGVENSSLLAEIASQQREKYATVESAFQIDEELVGFYTGLTDEQKTNINNLFARLHQTDFCQDPLKEDEIPLQRALNLLHEKSVIHNFNFPQALLTMLGEKSSEACQLFSALLDATPNGGLLGENRWWDVVMELLESIEPSSQTYNNLLKFKEYWWTSNHNAGEGHEQTRLRIMRDTLSAHTGDDSTLSMEDIEHIFNEDASGLISLKEKLDTLPSGINKAVGSVSDAFEFMRTLPEGKLWKDIREKPSLIPSVVGFFAIVAITGDAGPCHGHGKKKK